MCMGEGRETRRDETRRGLMTRKLNLVAKVKRLFVVPQCALLAMRNPVGHGAGKLKFKSFFLLMEDIPGNPAWTLHVYL